VCVYPQYKHWSCSVKEWLSAAGYWDIGRYRLRVVAVV